jgi:hypothetical protein
MAEAATLVHHPWAIVGREGSTIGVGPALHLSSLHCTRSASVRCATVAEWPNRYNYLNFSFDLIYTAIYSVIFQQVVYLASRK